MRTAIGTETPNPMTFIEQRLTRVLRFGVINYSYPSVAVIAPGYDKKLLCA